MILVCPGCKNQITIDEATVPRGVFKVRCTSCGRTINAQQKDEPAPPAQKVQPPQTEMDNASFAAGRTPAKGVQKTPDVSPAVQEYVTARINDSRREILEAMQALFRGEMLHGNVTPDYVGNSKNALICSSDATITASILSSLNSIGYRTETCTTAAESLKNLDSQYGLIIVDPSFPDDLEGAKKVIGRINGKKGTERRQTFLVLVSSTYKTLDGNSAFMNGVNVIINKADLHRLDSVLQQSQAHFQQVYKAFRSVADQK